MSSPEKPQNPDQNSERFQNQIEMSIDQRINDLNLLDEVKSTVLLGIKKHIMELTRTGDENSDLKINRGELEEVYKGIAEDEECKPMLGAAGISTYQNFMEFLGFSEFSSSENGLEKGKVVLIRDSNVFLVGGKLKGVAFIDDKVEVIDEQVVNINGVDCVKVKVEHNLGKFRPKLAGRFKTIVGYVPKDGLQGNVVGMAVAEPEPAPSEPVLAEPSPELAPNPEKPANVSHEIENIDKALENLGQWEITILEPKIPGKITDGQYNLLTDIGMFLEIENIQAKRFEAVKIEFSEKYEQALQEIFRDSSIKVVKFGVGDKGIIWGKTEGDLDKYRIFSAVSLDEPAPAPDQPVPAPESVPVPEPSPLLELDPEDGVTTGSDSISEPAPQSKPVEKPSVRFPLMDLPGEQPDEVPAKPAADRPLSYSKLEEQPPADSGPDDDEQPRSEKPETSPEVQVDIKNELQNLKTQYEALDTAVTRLMSNNMKEIMKGPTLVMISGADCHACHEAEPFLAKLGNFDLGFKTADFIAFSNEDNGDEYNNHATQDYKNQETYAQYSAKYERLPSTVKLLTGFNYMGDKQGELARGLPPQVPGVDFSGYPRFAIVENGKVKKYLGCPLDNMQNSNNPNATFPLLDLVLEVQGRNIKVSREISLKIIAMTMSQSVSRQSSKYFKEAKPEMLVRYMELTVEEIMRLQGSVPSTG